MADEDRVLVKYSCSNLEDGQYEYLDFNKSSSEVFMFRTSLEDFGMQPDNQKFEEVVPEEEGRKLIDSFLPELKNKIDIGSDFEYDHDFFQSYRDYTLKRVCPDPDTKTKYHMVKKVENGLTYYRFAISCRFHQLPFDPSHFTCVEIAVDELSRNFKNGLPELVYVGRPRSNEFYMMKKELESILNERNKFPDVDYNPLTERYPNIASTEDFEQQKRNSIRKKKVEEYLAAVELSKDRAEIDWADVEQKLLEIQLESFEDE